MLDLKEFVISKVKEGHDDCQMKSNSEDNEDAGSFKKY